MKKIKLMIILLFIKLFFRWRNAGKVLNKYEIRDTEFWHEVKEFLDHYQIREDEIKEEIISFIEMRDYNHNEKVLFKDFINTKLFEIHQQASDNGLWNDAIIFLNLHHIKDLKSKIAIFMEMKGYNDNEKSLFQYMLRSRLDFISTMAIMGSITSDDIKKRHQDSKDPEILAS